MNKIEQGLKEAIGTAKEDSEIELNKKPPRCVQVILVLDDDEDVKNAHEAIEALGEYFCMLINWSHKEDHEKGENGEEVKEAYETMEKVERGEIETKPFNPKNYE